ncbi:alpha/beta hydrolase [Nocardia asteroides]|uniref:Esterase n=1 Tax=Nocardia asteroides NBRC 15531 TaxID=1110697 RepID=U5EAA1_NOCAS|nr:alpha/beta hydrolase [Nocardia asteroides]TLF70103.1 alpha/beta hydrolase [Nocardia asteroides NBRC 15531]UGT49628.1 alpha/beta hydrolase [Nocardia asteroides]SFL96631.1 Acetyl esterase/lipase [Nocardia asteroides]VEG37687.1 Monoterpene epsilon-lactone hydrolase [Nocardia asteroides]GAD84275.1 putative esterase [Nocardia asteroides NBRC 15531]
MREFTIPLPIVRAVLDPVFRVTLNARLPVTVQRALLDVASRLQLMPDGSVVQHLQLGGRPAERVIAEAAMPGSRTGAVPPERAAGAILYLHGGGYVVGSLATHRSLVARLARDSSCAVYSLDYRLAPEHPFPAGLDDAETAFLDLVGNVGYRPDQICVAGDSAGGGLALALAQRLIERHQMTPAALGLIAPWVDPTQVPSRSRDLVINRAWSQACAAYYLGDGAATEAGYAPLAGNLIGLPPTYVQADVSELLHDQCCQLVSALRGAGVHVRFTETRGLWHVAQLQAALVTEAALALSELAEFLREAIQPVSIDDLR